MSNNFCFSPYLPFWTKKHRKKTNYVWPFQFDYVMHEVEMCIAELVQESICGVKVYTFFFLKMTDCFTR